jgi:hypothetical protein
MQELGHSAASIPILEALPSSAVGGGLRNVVLARAYAEEGRYAVAADTLLLITEGSFYLRSAQDAARLLRSAPTKVNAPESLPRLDSELGFVYAHVGALDRLLEPNERTLDIDYNVGASALWHPSFADLRKTERFKTFVRKAGLVDYWKAHGWPNLCRPVGSDDFVCD